MRKGLFVILVGPSGVGKTASATALLKRLPDAVKMITSTTRAPRPGELDGRDYRFMTREEFLEKRESGWFLESTETYGHFYGSSLSDIERQSTGHEVVIGILDVKGTRQVKSLRPETLAIFIEPESPAQLDAHLRERAGGDPADFVRRRRAADVEMSAADEFDHRVVNREGRLEDTLASIEALILGRLDSKQ